MYFGWFSLSSGLFQDRFSSRCRGSSPPKPRQVEASPLEEHGCLTQREEPHRQDLGAGRPEAWKAASSALLGPAQSCAVWSGSVSGLSSPAPSPIPSPSPRSLLRLPQALQPWAPPLTPRTQLQAAPRSHANPNTGSAFTSPSLSCFSLSPLRCLEEGLGSDAHSPTWLGQECYPPPKRDGVRGCFPQKGLRTEQQITGISNTSSHTKCVCVCVYICVCAFQETEFKFSRLVLTTGKNKNN